MVLRITQLLTVLIAALTVSTQSAVAQDDPGEITRAAVQAMQRVTENTIDDIQAAAAHGIAVIQQLDADGAPDRQIIAAAHRAFEAVSREATRGNRHINMIAARAAAALRELHADRRFFQIVGEARTRSHEAINQSHRRAHNAIQIALEEALDG